MPGTARETGERRRDKPGGMEMRGGKRTGKVIAPLATEKAPLSENRIAMKT